MQEGAKARTAVQNVFHAVFGAFHADFIEKEGEIWYFQGGHSTDIVLVCTNDTRMDGGPGLTITGMRNVTITGSNAKGSIPANRGQLALLVWNTAGRPEPAGAPAFADVTDPDMAKAAQWCTEQGTMATKGDRFDPEGWTPKFKVIEVWNKAFPAA